jgi:formylglycine-generating enzyme required for sulfatase activity
MSPSLNNKKPIRSGGRFDFDRPTSVNSWPDWQIPDFINSPAPGRQSIAAQSTDDYYQQPHAPAPMQKRAKAVRRRREPRRPGGWLTALIIGALISLASFVIVFDLASDGSVRRFIQSYLLPPDGAEPGKSVASNELPAPAPQDSAETIEPKSPSVQDAPPATQAKPTAPEDADANVTVPTPVPPPPAQVEAAAPPAIQPSRPQEPPQVAVEVAKPTELAPSPPPVPAPVPEKPADTAEQKASPAPVAATPQQGDVIRDCANCPELVVVSAGSFMKVDEANPKGPTKVANIDHDFAIARNDITFDDWDKCVTDGACQPVAEDAGWGRGNRPLIFVSFDDVTTHYLPWLSKLTGKEYRLPTKDEWQYAAVGGSDASHAQSQSGGVLQDCFNASGPPAGNCPDTYNGTAPAGSFPPNALGLNDMKGNVWEWSTDCWRPFTYAPDASPNACDKRVVLGGAWSTSRSEVNGQTAAWEKSSRRANSIGFRVVRSLH